MKLKNVIWIATFGIRNEASHPGSSFLEFRTLLPGLKVRHAMGNRSNFFCLGSDGVLVSTIPERWIFILVHRPEDA